MPPDIKVIKLKIRRGTDTERKLVTLDQGELGFTTDTRRIFVGDGLTPGGTVVGTKIYTNYANSQYGLLSTINAQVGDVVPINGVSYQLSGTDYTKLSSWTLFSPTLNTKYLAYSNGQTGSLTIAPSSLDRDVINLNSLSSRTIGVQNGRFTVIIDSTVLSSEPDSLTIKDGGIAAKHISTSAIGNGLSGGGGIPLTLNIDPNTLGFQPGTGKLTILGSLSGFNQGIKTSNLGVGFNTVYGAGSAYTINTVIAGVSNDDFNLIDRTIYLNAPPLSSRPSGINEMASIVCQNGYITDIQSSIYDFLSCSSSNPSMTAYNGVADQLVNGYSGSHPQTIITAISSSSNGLSSFSLNLTSAGFIVFRGQEQVRGRASIPCSFAIPIFSLPVNLN